ncbi:angio-associated migratory cell protein [Venturia canescens]|uniref:angio-associated migratory cell protein n=1 Tax=Venturia canescens TaxID=32260 RepID=UPI001C9D545F|nr:angio-associated migratory cell protein [Venturia canescens]
MLNKDTPPGSPEVEENLDEEDLIYIGDVDEVLEVMEHDDEIEDESMEEEGEQAEQAFDKGDAFSVFTKHEGSVFCGCLSRDGKYAATGGEDDMAYLWDTSSSEVILECKGHKDSLIFTGFNHDDTYLATGDMSGIIKVWKISEKNVVWDFDMGDATWMRWHRMANVLFAGSVEGDVYMWRIPDGECKIFQGFGQRCETAVVVPDGKRLAVGYEDGTVRVLDLKTGTVQSTSTPGSGHSSAITDLDCQSDGKLIISAAVDGKTILRTPQTGLIVATLQDLQENRSMNREQSGESSAPEIKDNWVEAVAFCSDIDLQLAATGTVNGEIFIWDITKKVLRHKITQESGVSKLEWKGKTPFLFSAGLDGVLRCYDARTAQCVKSFTGHNEDILDLYISADGTRILTTSDDSTARVFDLNIC